MYFIILSSAACPALPYFFIVSHKRQDFLNFVLKMKYVSRYYLEGLDETLLTHETIKRDIIINTHRSACKVAVIRIRYL